MPIRVVFKDQQLGPRFANNMRRNRDRVLAASRSTAEEAAALIEDRGRANIAQAGNFGSRWTDGFTARVTEGGGFLRITMRHAVAYWSVFQFGKVIEGKPLLWIPLSFAGDAQGVRARDFPGSLFRVDRLGKAPLLMAKTGATAEPKYFGKESVTIPKKFRLLEIGAEVARRMKDLYRANFKKSK